MKTKITANEPHVWQAHAFPYDAGAAPDRVSLEAAGRNLHIDCVSLDVAEFGPGEFFTTIDVNAARSLHEWLGAWLERTDGANEAA